MESYQERLVSETKDLAEKLNKLNGFMQTKKFYELPRNKKDLLYEQSRIMSEYLQVLGKRLELDFIKLTDDFWGITST